MRYKKHEKVPYGLCGVCGHHGDDCRGIPSSILHPEHAHQYKPGKSNKIATCACGSFKHINLKPEDIIREVKHTPTPYEFVPEKVHGNERFKAMYFPKWLIEKLSGKTHKEIFNAVNSHEELLEMLKKLTNRIDKYFYSLPEDNENEGKEWKRLYEMSCEAIAKAEGNS